MTVRPTTAPQTTRVTTRAGVRGVVVAPPLLAVAYVAYWAWFQHGVFGPSFTEVIPGTYFANGIVAGLLVLLAVAALGACAVAGFRFVIDGTRTWLIRYLAAAGLVAGMLVALGVSTVIGVT